MCNKLQTHLILTRERFAPGFTRKMLMTQGNGASIYIKINCKIGNHRIIVMKQLHVVVSPPVLMHGGLLCVAFCPSVCLCQNTRKKVTRKNSYLRNRLTQSHQIYFILCIDVIKRSKVKRVKVTRGQGQRSRSKVKVTINVTEKAGGHRPTSSCFIVFLNVPTVQVT